MTRSHKLRESARDEQCTMGSPMCNGNPETVVLCHSDFHEHGRGMNLKASDLMSFYGCSGCNYWLDVESKRTGVSNDERRLYFYRAWARTLERMREKGLVRVA